MNNMNAKYKNQEKEKTKKITPKDFSEEKYRDEIINYIYNMELDGLKVIYTIARKFSEMSN